MKPPSSTTFPALPEHHEWRQRGHFRFFITIVVVTSVNVLLALSTTVSMIAYGLLGYTSHVYDAFGQQKLNIKRLHAKIAGQALGGQVWRELVTETYMHLLV